MSSISSESLLFCRGAFVRLPQCQITDYLQATGGLKSLPYSRTRSTAQKRFCAVLQTVEKLSVIANQSADWCGDPLNFREICVI